MDPLLEQLEPYNPRPVYAQVALQGGWENAVKIDFDLEHDHTTHPIGHVDNSVAVELFYELNDGRQAFTGFRYSDELQAVRTPQEFFDIFLDTMSNSPSSNMRDLIATLGQRCDARRDTYLKSKLSYCELGVIDFWKSLGSLILWRSGQPTLTDDMLSSTLAANPSLRHNTKNNIAVEFAFKNPEHWLGIQVSARVANEYVLDTTALLHLLQSVGPST